MKQPGFFDFANRYESISKFGDPLERLNKLINFELFRKEVEGALGYSKDKLGRPSYDSVLMLKVLLLQALYNLSDEQVEYQIKDRLSFMRFLGLRLEDKVPDAKTVWVYRERFIKNGLIDKIFSKFDRILKDKGYLAMSGQIVDASIISAPKQRNTKEEKEKLAKGEIPEDWSKHPSKLAQKDRDARWMVKYSKAKPSETKDAIDIAVPLFGYKNHLSTDKRFGFIRKYQVTDASRSDGKLLPNLLDKENTASSIWGDTAYRSKLNEAYIAENGYTSQIHRKKPKGKPMPKHISRANNQKSKIRSKVEHVFAVQKDQMKLFIRTIGIKRASLKIGMVNLAYNMKRYVFWEKRLAFTG